MSIFQKGLFGGSSSGGGGGSGTGWDGRVNTFADLPSAATNTGKYYMVDTATGTHGVDRKEAGIYKSDGSSWTLCGTAPLTAVVIGGIVVAAAALGVFGSSTIKVTPDVVNGTMTIEGNYTGGTGINVTDNVVTATGNFGSENVYTTGNIGVGTTAPTSKLNVVGNVTATGADIETINATSVSATNLRVGTSTTSGYVLTADSGGNATWQTATGGGGSPRNVGVTYRNPWSVMGAGSNATIYADSGNGLTFNSVYVQLTPMNQTKQLNGNLRYSDHDGTSPYLICALDTTNGTATITSFTNAVVPAGKRVYVDWDDAPAITVSEQAMRLNVTDTP